MIAKPTHKTLPVTIILIILIALLGWLFGDKTDAPSSVEKPTTSSPHTIEE